ncbi:hypothetical protein ASC92_22365 [Variovorax sp. Root411]|nr:hypothetical protein ASC92_22365 [Variovorax sp. Root411]
MARFLGSYVQAGLVLDQGEEGACTGFGLACVANYLLWVAHVEANPAQPFEEVSPRMLYELARRYDEWPGTDYEGSSCRGALKGWNKHGVCSRKNWPYVLGKGGTASFQRPLDGWQADACRRPLGVYYRIDRTSIVDLQAALCEIGAVYVSASVHDGWDTLIHAAPQRPPMNHASLPIISPPTNPGQLGGHAFAFVGFNAHGFIVQNSWGKRWGASGFGVLPYDDWVVHGTDAWACALGVPLVLSDAGGKPRSVAVSAFRVPSGRSLGALNRATRAPGNPADDPWPVDHPFRVAAYQPWTTPRAYEHTLVTGNDGELVPTDFTRGHTDMAGLVGDTVHDRPLAWFAKQPAAASVLKLAIYAHGGLNSEDESIRRIRVLAPYFLANGIYPLFLTWKTGAGETLGDMAKDWVRKLFGAETERAAGVLDVLGDAKDRAIEALGHVLGKGIWSEMRENAEIGASPGKGLDLLSRQLALLVSDLARKGARLELHLVGHSAGSILFGHLLDRCVALNATAAATNRLRVASCTLLAPACSVRFAVQHYLAAAQAGVIDLGELRLHVLSDENEKKDALPSPSVPAYGKSLLYLVSRALDDVRKMPLLGLVRTHDPKYANDDDQWAAAELPQVMQWQAAWPPVSAAGKALLDVVLSPQVTNTREHGQIQSTHGSFDNNIEIMTEILLRFAGGPLIGEIEWLDY